MRVLPLDLLRIRTGSGERLDADLDAEEREWFAGCKRNHIAGLPGGAYEAVRVGMLLWISRPSPPWFLALCAMVALALIGSLRLLYTARCNNLTIIGWWRIYIVCRGLALAVIAAFAIAYVPSARLVPLLLALLMAYGVEAYAQFPLPGSALLAQVFGLFALVAALALRGGTEVPLLIVLALLQGLSAWLRITNFYYMFATRRLRTRKLKIANETIQLLLNQYDEHGSDCLVETDRDGQIGHASERLGALVGRPQKQIIGQPLAQFFEPGTGRDAIMAAIAALAPFRDVECAVAREDSVRWWLSSGCATFDSEGEFCGYRWFIRDVTVRHNAESRVRYLARHDDLTALPNRAEFHNRLDTALRRLRLHGRRWKPSALRPGRRDLAVLYIDLDRFKLVNDLSGHAAGDAVLVQTALRLSQAVGHRGLVARLGGDEFAVLMRGPVLLEDAVKLGESIVAAVSAPIQLDARVVRVGASVGVAMAGRHGRNGDMLVRAADLAQYEAKSSGGGCVVGYNVAIQREHAGRLRLQADLRMALARGEFVLYYQPVVDLGSGEVAGFEALVRWLHPQHGLLDPGTFVPLAEETGMIVPLGDWVLRAATAEAAKWPGNLFLAVNVSALQLHGGEIVRQTISALSASGLAPTRLELEITETVLIDNEERCLDGLNRLRNLGVRIALDDFGIGYSSLNYLRTFPFDKIKIDRCFVFDLAHPTGRPGESATIIRAVLDLAREMNLATVAEGIEEPEQLDQLRAMGCSLAQGWLTGRPVPASEIWSRWLASPRQAARRG